MPKKSRHGNKFHPPAREAHQRGRAETSGNSGAKEESGESLRQQSAASIPQGIRQRLHVGDAANKDANRVLAEHIYGFAVTGTSKKINLLAAGPPPARAASPLRSFLRCLVVPTFDTDLYPRLKSGLLALIYSAVPVLGVFDHLERLTRT